MISDMSWLISAWKANVSASGAAILFFFCLRRGVVKLLAKSRVLCSVLCSVCLPRFSAVDMLLHTVTVTVVGGYACCCQTTRFHTRLHV